MRRSLFITTSLAGLAVAGLALTACSSGSSSSSTTEAPAAASAAAASGQAGEEMAEASAGTAEESAAPSMVGGMTDCTKETLQKAADVVMKAKNDGNMYTVDSVTCDSGWAVTSGTLGPKDAPSSGPQGAPTPMIFQAEGQFWIPKEAKDVCGTNYSTATTAPSDAQIPAKLFTAGCLTG